MLSLLHRNQGQVAMRRNLSQPPNLNVVKGTLALETRDAALHGLAQGVESLPFRSLNSLSNRLLVTFVRAKAGVRLRLERDKVYLLIFMTINTSLD